MPFCFRRSIRIGGIRLDVSQSGISYSFSPIKRFRITSGSLGTAGPRGFDYQERFDTPLQQNRSPEEASVHNFDSAPTADVSHFVDVSSYRMLTEVNRRKSTIRIAPIVGGMFGFVTLTMFAHDAQIIGLIAIIATTVTTMLAASYDRRRRTTFLHYDLRDGFSHFAEKQRICQILLQSAKVWRVSMSQSPADSKGDRQAESHWSRREVVIGKGLPPCIETNVDTWGIDAGSMKLYFFPDYLFVLQNGRYGAVSYGSLTAQVSESPFIEHSSVPKDANIVGYTWKYVRSDGGPDRWSNNRQLPIAMYGLLVLNSSSGLNICLQCSNHETAQQAAQQIEHPKPPSPEDPKPQQPEAERSWGPPRPSKRTAISDYDVLEISRNASDEEITAAYIRLAKMYHPDKVEGLAPEYKVIAITRMKEINDAYAKLKSRQRGQ